MNPKYLIFRTLLIFIELIELQFLLLEHSCIDIEITVESDLLIENGINTVFPMIKDRFLSFNNCNTLRKPVIDFSYTSSHVLCEKTKQVSSAYVKTF